jgi:hypothetical protein
MNPVGTLDSEQNFILPMEYDVWEMALLFIPFFRQGKIPEPLPFYQVVKNGQKIGQVARRSDGLRECIVVELIDADGVRRELWFDPAVNFLIRKVVYTEPHNKGNAGDVRTEIIVSEFVEVTPSVFFPGRVEMNRFVNDDLKGKRETTFSDIRMNEPVAPGLFDFRFPANTPVTDTVLGKHYLTDANGNPGTEERPIPAIFAPPVQPGVGTVSTEDPTSWSKWMLPASLGVLGGAAGLWMRRRWLASSDRRSSL